jgi:NADH:ubiquinone reductase (non-electrogenic)
MEPIRNFLRHKKAAVKYYEAEATKIDYEKRVVYVNDESPIKGDVSQTEIPFDMLVVGVGAENATFGTSCTTPARDTANLVQQVSPVSASTVCS